MEFLFAGAIAQLETAAVYESAPLPAPARVPEAGPGRTGVNLDYLFSDGTAAGGRMRGLVRKVDSAGLFVDGDRNQGAEGTCHAFASVAVLEAAYARRYGRKIRYSEADLFLRRVVIGRPMPQNMISGLPELLRAGLVSTDLEFALAHGVADGPDYGEFVKKLERMPAFISELLPWYWVFLGTQGQLQLSDELREELIGYFGLNTSDKRVERELFRWDFKGYTVAYERFYAQAAAEFVSPTRPGESCRRRSERIAASITAELDAGRPVGVCMFWNESRFSSHCVVFTGYQTEVSPEGGARTSFSIRNSWGDAKKKPIKDDSLCRVIEISSLIPPGEKSGFLR
ncbi:MAG: hypothetical protein WCW52_06910 [Elusimicrobiales bacterium]|jgi:hypothetical protein